MSCKLCVYDVRWAPYTQTNCSDTQASPQEVAKATIDVLEASVPSKVKHIVEGETKYKGGK
jgi:hypothetical protein